MPIRIYYQKNIENNKIVFYSQHFQSFWEYIQKDGYATLFMLGFPVIFIVVCTIEILMFDNLSSVPIGNNIIGLIFSCLFFFILLWLVLRAKNFFFELTASKKEISFYTTRQQWTYKVADIKKIRENKRYVDDHYQPIFFIEIEGEIKEIEPFPSKLASNCYLFPIIKDLCQHTRIKLEDEFGNLIKL